MVIILNIFETLPTAVTNVFADDKIKLRKKHAICFSKFLSKPAKPEI
jgi:hypothetical protein